MQSTPGTVRNNAKELALMSLYMQRTQRAYERYRNDLKQMQEERKARHAQELEQARMLYQRRKPRARTTIRNRTDLFFLSRS